MMLFTKAFEKAVAKFPLYSQDGKGKEAKVLGRFFCGRFTWYILEGNDVEFFALVGNGDDCFEYGYVSRSELERLSSSFGGVERDRWVAPAKMTLGECMETYGEKIMGE